MADEMKVKRSLHVEPGEEAFLCDSVTISHNPSFFVFDLRQNTPFFVPEHQNVTVKQVHKTVVMTAQMAKELRRVLDAQIQQYEKEVAAIKSGKKPEKVVKPKKEDHHYG